MCSFSQTGKQLFKHHGGLALLDTKDDLGFVRCSLYYTTNPQIAEGPWLAIGSKAGGDDLIALGNEGDFDHGLCYSAPPVSSGVGGERGGSASFFYWGVNGEHYAPHNASFGVATVPKGRTSDSARATRSRPLSSRRLHWCAASQGCSLQWTPAVAENLMLLLRRRLSPAHVCALRW
jgi:hypothetical protein